MKFEANLFQTKLLSPLSHNVCHLLCSSVLLHKFTFDTSKPKNTVLSKFQYESGTTPQKIYCHSVCEKEKKLQKNIQQPQKPLLKKYLILLYWNTNEIPGELSHENISSHVVLFSHVKRLLMLVSFGASDVNFFCFSNLLFRCHLWNVDFYQ